MSEQVVKYPSSAAGEPDRRFCGQCGRRCQPLINDNAGFGPCIDDADSALECPSLRQQIVNSYTMAKALNRPVHADTAALVFRLGIPEAMLNGWMAKAERVSIIHHEVSAGALGDPKFAFVDQALEWIGEGDSEERLLALIEVLRIGLDPTEKETRSLTMGEIMDWYARVGKRANEILSDAGDWEPTP